jgi:hypothetical protein
VPTFVLSFGPLFESCGLIRREDLAMHAFSGAPGLCVLLLSCLVTEEKEEGSRCSGCGARKQPLVVLASCSTSDDLATHLACWFDAANKLTSCCCCWVAGWRHAMQLM